MTSDQLSLTFAALADPTRRAILSRLAGGEASVTELAEPFNNLAVIHAAQGELDLAHSELEQALRVQPDHAQAQENLGDVLLRLAARAYQRAQAALLTPPDSLAIKLRRTQALLLLSATTPP